MEHSEPTLFDQNRDGETYDRPRDFARLNEQHRRVYRAMADGEWRTLSELALLTGDPEASISARLRDFRKDRFGAHTLEREYLGDGQWRYRLLWNPEVPEPTMEAV